MVRIRKSPVKIQITNTGSLTSLGYSLYESTSIRRNALKKAVDKFGYGSVMKKINALYVFNKNNYKELAKRASSDKKWLARQKSRSTPRVRARFGMKQYKHGVISSLTVLSNAPQWLLPPIVSERNYDESVLVLPEPPHPRCNYVSPDGLLIVGVMPSSAEVELLLKAGVELFVDLTDEGGTYKVNKPAKIVRFPIDSGRAPSVSKGREISKLVRDTMEKGKRVYVHCHGGNGRANTIIAVALGEEHKLNALQAINLVQSWRRTRPDSSRTDIVPIPETTSQVNFLVKSLGIPDGADTMIPDRTDMSWLVKLKKMRKETKKQEIQVNQHTQSLRDFLKPHILEVSEHELDTQEWTHKIVTRLPYAMWTNLIKLLRAHPVPMPRPADDILTLYMYPNKVRFSYCSKKEDPNIDFRVSKEVMDALNEVITYYMNEEDDDTHDA
jgi:hypothetical protein